MSAAIRSLDSDTLAVLVGDKAQEFLSKVQESASIGGEVLAPGVVHFQHEGQTWLDLEGYYAQITILNTLRDVRRPCVDSTHCLFVEGNPRYVRLSLLKPFSSILVLKASEHGEPETDALIDFCLKQNDAVISWPEDEEGKLKFFEYYALLKGMVGQTVYDQLNTSGVQLSGVYLRESQGELMILVHGNVLVPYGKKMMGVLQHSILGQFEANNMRQLRFVPVDDANREVVRANAAFAASLVEHEGPFHVNYSGVGYIPGPQNTLREIGVSSRAIMDPEGCRQVEPEFFTAIYAGFDYRINTYGREPSFVSAMGAAERENVAAMVVTYDLKGSRWFCGSPARTTPISFSENAFDDLVLEEETKELIQACVMHRTAKLDGISGKDTGALFLLSGAPGTGKTLCAESVAELLKKPLYKVGMGELGTNAQEMDTNLKNILSLGERWKAILLIDEADVFMSKRDQNLERNAIVATALKHLEYYGGTLMLTTNLANNIDPAFKSRITMAVHFPEPTPDKMAAIWRNLLKRSGFAEAQINEYLDRLLAYTVNGREIKNTCATALALATFRKQEPSIEHLIDVLEKWKVFNDVSEKPVAEAA